MVSREGRRLLIDWVHEKCRCWGSARHFIDHGVYGAKSIFGRLNDGWSIAAADSHRRPDPPEVMLDDALEISIAIKKAIAAKRLTERQFQVLYVHYVELDATKRKLDTLKLSRKRYYDIIHRVHRILRWHLPLRGCVGDKIAETKAA